MERIANPHYTEFTVRRYRDGRCWMQTADGPAEVFSTRWWGCKDPAVCADASGFYDRPEAINARPEIEAIKRGMDRALEHGMADVAAVLAECADTMRQYQNTSNFVRLDGDVWKLYDPYDAVDAGGWRRKAILAIAHTGADGTFHRDLFGVVMSSHARPTAELVRRGDRVCITGAIIGIERHQKGFPLVVCKTVSILKAAKGPEW